MEAVHAWSAPTELDWSELVIDHDFDLNQARERFAQGLCTVFADQPPADLREHLVEGDPSEVLTGLSQDADVLVVGNRGRGGFVRAMLGSVGRRCAQHAACPVVVVRRDRQP